MNWLRGEEFREDKGSWNQARLDVLGQGASRVLFCHQDG